MAQGEGRDQQRVPQLSPGMTFVEPNTLFVMRRAKDRRGVSCPPPSMYSQPVTLSFPEKQRKPV